MPATAAKTAEALVPEADQQAAAQFKLTAPDTPDAAEDMPAPRVLVERLRELRAELGPDGKRIDEREIAVGIGIHQVTLSRILGGKLALSDEIARKAWAYLKVRDLQAAVPVGDEDAVARTSVVARVEKLIAYCQVERVIGMLVSETSMGKTTSLLAYCKANPAAIYVHAGRRNSAPVRLVDALWQASGLRQVATRKPGLAAQWDALVRVLRSKGPTARVLIVDDAHVLTYEALETLRELHDDTGIGIVLAGTTRLEGTINLRGDAHQMYEQLRARVQMVREIRRPNATDTMAVAAAHVPAGVKFTEAAKAYLVALAQRLGAFRLVKAHVRMALHLGGAMKVGTEIDERHLMVAHEQLERSGSPAA